MNRIYIVALAFVAFVTTSCQEKKTSSWENLIKENTLDGWSIKGGKSTYELKDGVIIGTTIKNEPNTFLTTNKHYSDFILELEYLVDDHTNSGIQIRTNSFPEYKNGRVHGYQIEIDPSERAWSGGIFEEAKRGWLNDLEDNVPAKKAFKAGDWNKYRIEAIGDTIKTWINGVPAAHLVDNETASGFIGLQIHRGKAGRQIRWRNIRIISENVRKHAKATTIPVVAKRNHLTKEEKENGWELLWDGKTTKGWKSAKADHFPKQGWKIRNGILRVLASGGAESAHGGDIVTKELYDNFELKVDFKTTPGANSGIKYYVDTNINKGPGSSIGLEYQILDDALHPDAKKGSHEGSRTVSSLYDLIQADTNKPIKPVGEWNTVYIKSVNNHVEHWLNGVKVIEYERGSKHFKKLVAESKYKKWKGFGLLEKGQILLQDHGDLVSFRNIKIKKH
ncbi:3-keto-disaccharide hydrolase [Wenyingzhuangia sp. IMCC45574]